MAEDIAPQQTAVTITLNGREISAEKGEMIIAAAERAGTYIPRFCYHPRMEPVGNCRMCLVEVEGPRGSTLMPSCFIGAADGMVVVTDSEKVKKAQDGVLEFLLANHPLDCPVCDKGGECPLQDQTLAHGPGETRFVEEKRHFAKPIPISDLVLLDRERCIQCSRCTRFADEVAGEALIDFAGRGDQVEVATFPGEPFSSYFSGNTVQICPVGALTATPYRFAARPWDLEQVESTCTGCAVGCRVAVQSSAGRITRLLGVDADAVNHGWMCDKGRFAFESVNGPDDGGVALALSDPSKRITDPMVRKGGVLVPTGWGEALDAAAAIIRDATATSPMGLGAIGGSQMTNEGAFAWNTLLKGVVGTDSVDAQLGDGLEATHVLGLPRATIDEAADACTLILLTGDLREELPVLFLRLRAGAVAKRSSIVDLSPRSNALGDLAAVRLPTRPGDSLLVTRCITGDAAAKTQLASHPEGRTFTDDDLERARTLIGDDGAGVVIIVGRSSLAEDASLIEAAARRLNAAYPKAKFLPALRRANVMGALDMGLAPGILPGRTMLGTPSEGLGALWPTLPDAKGLGTLAQLAAMAAGSQKATLVLGADLADVPDAGLVTAALDSTARIIAVTGHGGTLLERADVVLPAAVAHERPGTTTNIEGRVSRLGQKLSAPGQAWPDWMIATELAAELGSSSGVSTVADVTNQIAAVAPSYAGMTAEVLNAANASDGLVAPLSGAVPRELNRTDPTAIPGLGAADRIGLASYTGSVRPDRDTSPPSRVATTATIGTSDLEGFAEPTIPSADNYSLRLVATRRLYDLGAAVTASPALRGLADSAVAKVNPYDLDRIGVTTGDSVRLRSARTAAVVAVEADAEVVRGTVLMEFNLSTDGEPRVTVADLIDASAVVTDLRMESL
ncbi:MAG: NADH-quinone oxidoreductase subunit NuoG [Actinomycetes bacterium]